MTSTARPGWPMSLRHASMRCCLGSGRGCAGPKSRFVSGPPEPAPLHHRDVQHHARVSRPRDCSGAYFWTMLVEVNLVSFPQRFLGLAGLPRRYALFRCLCRLKCHLFLWGVHSCAGIPCVVCHRCGSVLERAWRGRQSMGRRCNDSRMAAVSTAAIPPVAAGTAHRNSRSLPRYMLRDLLSRCYYLLGKRKPQNFERTIASAKSWVFTAYIRLLTRGPARF